MSYVKSVDLHCDRCGESESYPMVATVTEARSSARRVGWKYRKGADLCPDCAAQPREGE